MKDVKQAVSVSGNQSKAIFRIICAILFAPAICTAVYTGIKKWLEYCGYTSADIANAEKIWEYAGIPIIIIVTLIYIFRTLRRRYAYSYMLDYYSQLNANGCTVCPRCGSSVSLRHGKKSYQAHVGDKITTTHYSDGTKSVQTNPIYETRFRKYTYHQCDNGSCAIEDHSKLKYGHMPYKRGDLRLLILQDTSASKNSAGYLVNGGKHTMRMLLIFIVIAAVVVLMLITKNNNDSIYGQFGGKEAKGVSVTSELGKDEKEYIGNAKNIIKNNMNNYRLSVKEQKSGLFQHENKAEVYGWKNDDKVDCLTVRLEGMKTESGIDGLYYLMPYEGKDCIFSDKDTTIYPPDSDFYKANYDALKKWDGASVMNALLDKIQTGELYYKEDTASYALRSDKISLYIPEEGSVRILDESGDVPIRYIFSPSKDGEKPHNYADFKLLGAEDTETDPLQKLLNTTDYDAKIEFYEDGDEIAEIRYEDNGDGSHTFRFEDNYKDFVKAEYVIYPDESRYEVYLFDGDYSYSDKPQKYKKSDNKDTYDWLYNMIPDNFVKANLDLDKAEEGSILWVTTYTQKVDGKDKAVLSAEGGTVKKFNCYETEKNYVEIRW